MSYGQSHTQPLPTVGTTLGSTYATYVNAVLTEMRATLDAKVTPSGMDINGDLSLRSGATYYGLVDVHRLSLASQASALSAATYPNAAYVFDGDLYFNDASGNQIALTSGGALAGTPGTINGSGYNEDGVSLTWDSGETTYNFYSAASTYADIVSSGLRLHDGSGNYARLLVPSLAADYDLTLPNAVPAANNSVVQVSIAGVVSWTDSPTVTALTTTGDVTVGDDLAVTGVTTLADTVTVATDKNVVLQGDGKLVHGSRFLVVAGAAFNGGIVADDGTVTGVSGQDCVYSIPLPAGTLISNVAWEAEHGSNSGSRTYRLRRIPANGGAPVTVETDSSSAQNSAVSIVTQTDVNVMSSGSAYALVWHPAGGDNLISVTISYSTPA